MNQVPSAQSETTTPLPDPGVSADRAAGPRGWLPHYALIVMFPALAMLYVKYCLLVNDGYRVVARHVGRIELLTPTGMEPRSSLFSVGEKLSFFRWDLLTGLLLMPLAAMVVPRVLGRRWGAVLLAVLSIALTWALYVDFQAQAVLGRFLSVSLIRDAVSFGRTNSETTRAYVAPGKLIKPLLGTLLIVGCAWWACRASRDRENARPPRPIARRPSVWAAAATALLVALAWVPWMHPTSYHAGALTLMVDALADHGDEADLGEFAHLSAAQLERRYRELTGAPAPVDVQSPAGPGGAREAAHHAPPAPSTSPAGGRPYWGSARDCDVILFVLETAPARCLSPDGDLSDCPNLARLRRRAWIADRHYSTYPYTSYALFSVLTSWYPASLGVNFPDRLPARSYPGLMSSLRDAGYVTALYAPDAYTRVRDDSMYKRLGVERRTYADRSAPPRTPAGASERPGAAVIARDRAALESMKRDVADWLRQGRRFACLFTPQVGHAPWVDLSGGTEPTTTVARGHRLIALQDAWLGELVDQLDRAGRLDKTIILVTGDHGIRTRMEDPTFAGGMVDDYSFHVPLLLYAPTALTDTQVVPWLTSHIDLTPSILDLVGVASGRRLEQGNPIWDPRLAARTTFFWAGTYLGSDGYHVAGRFAMADRLNGSVYEGGELHFDPDRDFVSDPGRRTAVTERIRRMTALQEAWANQAPPVSSPAP